MARRGAAGAGVVEGLTAVLGSEDDKDGGIRDKKGEDISEPETLFPGPVIMLGGG